MRWLRGDDENTTSSAMLSAGLAEIAGLFQPTRHKQTEHIEHEKFLRGDEANGQGIDLDRNVAIIRRRPVADPEPTD
jgi:hypothetical protein